MTASMLEAYVDDLLDRSDAAPAPAAPVHPAVQKLFAPAPLAAESAAPAPRARREQRWLLMRVGERSCAVELLCVQEVQRVTDIVPLRGARADLVGIVNLRGQIVPVVDLAHRLSFARGPVDDAARIVVLERRGVLAGLLVSAVTEVATLPDEKLERLATPFNEISDAALCGMTRHGGAFVVLLDADALVR
jgi:purine-binding chemotaxis protein CheW